MPDTLITIPDAGATAVPTIDPAEKLWQLGRDAHAALMQALSDAAEIRCTFSRFIRPTLPQGLPSEPVFQRAPRLQGGIECFICPVEGPCAF